MVRCITATNYLGQSIRLELNKPEESGLIVQSVDGLGPVKANVNTTQWAMGDGGCFNSARVGERNIVLSLAMLFAPTVEDARLLTYQYFPVRKRIRLMVETDRRTAEIDGYVESNEPDIFSKNEAAQISIICPDPYFYDGGGYTETVFSKVEPLFEFPFSSGLTEPSWLEMSRLKEQCSGEADYRGDVETGMLLTIHAWAAAKNIAVFNPDTRETMRIDTTLSPGDEFEVSTIKGTRYARLLRNGEYHNAIGCLNRDSDWFQLSPGKNTFVYSAEEGEDGLELRLKYRSAYGGV